MVHKKVILLVKYPSTFAVEAFPFLCIWLEKGEAGRTLCTTRHSNLSPRFVPRCLTILWSHPPKHDHEYIEQFQTKCFQGFQVCYWRKQINPTNCFLSALIIVQQHSSQAMLFSPNCNVPLPDFVQLPLLLAVFWTEESLTIYCFVLHFTGQESSHWKHSEVGHLSCPSSSQKLAYLQEMTTTAENPLAAYGNFGLLRELSPGQD